MLAKDAYNLLPDWLKNMFSSGAKGFESNFNESASENHPVAGILAPITNGILGGISNVTTKSSNSNVTNNVNISVDSASASPEAIGENVYQKFMNATNLTF